MRKRVLLTAVFLSVAAVAAVDRPDLSGTWQVDPAHNQAGDTRVKSGTLTIRQADGQIVLSETLTDTDGKERKLDIQCNTDGDQCKVKQGTVSFWYDKSVLVLMEVRKNNSIVVKTLFRISDDGKTLTVETNPIAPPGQKPETITFAKQADPPGR